jgi:hypothetical protein
MSMHPHFEEDPITLLASLGFSGDKEKIIDKLIELKFFDFKNKFTLMQKFSNEEVSHDRVVNIATALKLIIDPIVSNDGVISSARSLNLINNIVSSINYFNSTYLNIQNIKGKTALDFGSGIYNPLAVSIIKYINGFEKAFSFEPYPIKLDYSYSSTIEIITNILQQPNNYNFSGIDSQEIILRVNKLNLIDLRNKFYSFASGASNQLNLGPVILLNDMNYLHDNSVDFQSSNAVLEHVNEFEEYVLLMHKKMKIDGIGLHIVDFLDHRHYENRLLHPYEKYYDEILEEINGLTPHEMEIIFVKVGFITSKLVAKTVPLEYFTNEKRSMKGKYLSSNQDQLREHLNYYYLRK